MKSSRLAELCLVLLTASCALAQVLEVPLDRFGPAPAWCAAEKADRYDFTRQDGISTFTASGGRGTMIWTYDWAPPLDMTGKRYVTFRYRLQGTDPKLYSYTVYFADKGDGGMLAKNLIFAAENLMHDGQWHTARTTTDAFKGLQTLALRIRAQEGQTGRLEVAYLRVSAAPQQATLTETMRWEAGATGKGTPLGFAATNDQAAVQKALDLADWFPGEQVTAEGINFKVATTGQAAASTGEEKRESVNVPLDGLPAGSWRSYGTLYLLLGAKYWPQMLDYSGWAPGDMTARPEQFRVAIPYASGKTEEHVPYCLGQKQHGVWRGVQVYAVPLRANDTPQELRLVDGMRTGSFHLLGLTAGEEALPAFAEPKVVRTPAGVAAPLNVSSVVKMLAGATDNGVPFFSVTSDGKTWTSDTFRLTSQTQDRGATVLTFAQEEAKVEARLRLQPAVGQGGIQFSLSLRNLTDQPRTLDVICPQIRTSAPSAEDLWYFVPYQCAMWSDRDTAFEAPYSGYLPVQWMDCYNRRTGGGLYVATRDRDLRQRYFQLIKSGPNVTQRIEYRFNPPLAPNEWVQYPTTVIATHAGDWHAPWADYEKWFKSWYKPAKPRLPWYRNVWNFRTWWTHTMAVNKERWLECNLYDPDKQEYQTDTYAKRDREQFGNIDMVHFFDWRISKEFGAYGDFSHYDEIGGLEKFRGMVKDLQGRGIRVGLYLDAYLMSRKSQIAKVHGEEWALVGSDGKFGDGYSSAEDPMLNMCVNHPGWQDYLAQTCGRVARETGVDGIYIDEGMTDLQNYWCWSTKHGHPAPMTNQPGLLEISRKTRAALPDGCAFYTEWVPADTFIPHLDGGYQAGLRFADPALSPGFVQTARFTFPDFRVLTVSNGGSMWDGIWEGMKYSLFSGVPLYSLSWGHDEECLPVYRKYSEILQKYAGAFNTVNPRPFVDTEAAEVFANEFASGKQMVWTLFNGRYHSVSGAVLKVKHVPGATYLDVWNDKPILPRIAGNVALLDTTLGPRGIGCIVQTRK